MSEQLLPFLTASVLLTLSPGPDIIYVLVQGMSNGKKYGIITALGLVTGIIFHTGLVAFGVSAVITESPNLFLLIKFLGAAYLFFLAYKVYRSDPRIELGADSAPERNPASLYRQGLLMNLLNPKVAIFFLAFFPGFIWDPDGNTVYQFFILGFLFMIQALLIFIAVATLAGKIAGYLREHRNFGKIFKAIQIVVFLGIGIFILL